MKDLGDILFCRNADSGQPLAWATLVRVRGSSYRRAGARMAIWADGSTAGSLSAGCIEEEVAAHALEVLRDGEPKLIVFDTRRRFGCHGSIEILIERVHAAFILELREQFRARRGCVIETVFEGDVLGSRCLRKDQEQVAGSFIQRIQPRLRLVIIGDGADAASLATQGGLLGWDTHVLENISIWRDEADARTAFVIATHNFGRDCAALRYLLPLGLAYVGLIGPRRRREELMTDALDTGTAIISELFAPAGLDLGADSAEEIALSIVAEIQMVFARASAVQLRDRRAPIHAAPEPFGASACAELLR